MLRTLYHHLFGETVFSGPFRGLRYVSGSVGSVHVAKLLGTYERELHPLIEHLISRAPDVVVNIGAGEGYYAVGLAHRLPATRVIAFETEAHGRELIRSLATRNAVTSRLVIKGTATTDDLAEVLQTSPRRPCVVIDAEGAEDQILDPGRVPGLARCDILVEVHDFIAPIGERLLPRFAGTHRHQEVWSHPRCTRDLPALIRPIGLTPWKDKVLRALDEDRPGLMRWFWFEPKSR